MPALPDALTNAITRIVSDIDGQGWQGTGFLLSPDEVLTANHVSYMKGSVNGLASKIEVDPAYSTGLTPLGSYSGTVAHYFDMTNEPGIAMSDIQSDYSIIHLSTPVTGGSIVRLSADFAGGPAHVTGYPASAYGALVDETQTVTADPGYSIFEGQALSGGSSGSPVWNMGADGIANVYGLASASTDFISYDVKFTAAKVAQIDAWVKADDVGLLPPPPPAHVAAVLIHDGTTNQDVLDTTSHAYAGAVDYLKTEFIDITAHNLNVAAIADNVFIHTGSGDDAVALLSGKNVVDGGTGSNYLTGGTGTDTFFVDARHAAADIWSTVVGFHSGDAATMWGVAPGVSTLTWVNNEGAVGAKGLTLHETGASGGPMASLTLAGYSTADLASGRVTTQFGADSSGNAYLYIHAA